MGMTAREARQGNRALLFNSAILVGQDPRNGHWLGRYDKIHRVPFGEYIPFGKTFSFLEFLAPYDDGGYVISPGQEFTRFELPRGAMIFDLLRVGLPMGVSVFMEGSLFVGAALFTAGQISWERRAAADSPSSLALRPAGSILHHRCARFRTQSPTSAVPSRRFSGRPRTTRSGAWKISPASAQQTKDTRHD